MPLLLRTLARSRRSRPDAQNRTCHHALPHETAGVMASHHRFGKQGMMALHRPYELRTLNITGRYRS